MKIASLTEGQIIQNTLSSAFMVKVFSLVWYAMWISAISAFYYPIIAQTVPIFTNWIVNLILLLWIIFTQWMWAKKEPLNLIMFSIIAFLLWIWIAPLIYHSLAIDPSILAKAFVATSCLSLAAWFYWATTKKDLSWMSWFLTIALFWIIIVSVLNIFWPSEWVSLFVSWAWVILFSIFISYEVNTLKNYPENMAILAAIWLYLSIFNLFQSLLSLLTLMNWDD
jgi:FtsH-binding integral membrane protein